MQEGGDFRERNLKNQGEDSDITNNSKNSVFYESCGTKPSLQLFSVMTSSCYFFRQVRQMQILSYKSCFISAQ